MLRLRDYQVKSLESLREGFLAGHKTQILYMPTGSGKTESAISLMVATAEKNHRCAMIMDRRILVDQTSARLDKYGIDHGVLMAGHGRWKPYENIQICSAQTLEKYDHLPDFDLIIVDECHTQRRAIAQYIKDTGVRAIGLSASPFTRGIGAVYEHVVCDVTTRDLVEEGSLVPLKIFIAKEIDMTGAKKVGGEWSQAEAADRGIKITADIISEWVRKTHELYGKPEKTIIFCAGVAHGEDLQARFSKAGYDFISISYRDDDQYKADVIAEFSKPDSSITGLIATDILTKGFDVPDVKIGISARPFTKSFSSHVQQMGRVMRPCPGKDFAVWLDHSGNFLRFRKDWDDLFHSGVKSLKADTEKAKKEPTEREKEAAKCPKCSALWPVKSDICALCGYVRQRQNAVSVRPGELVEIDGSKKEEKEDRESFYRQLLFYAGSKGYKEGWAYHIYREKYKCKPVWAKVPADFVSAEVRGFLKHRAIKRAYAK